MGKFLKPGAYIVATGGILFLQKCLLGSYKIKTDITSDLVTFLSILFGFYITSLAIFATSQYVSGLYKIEDQDNKGRTLLHSLVNKYKGGLLLALFSILYFLFVEFMITKESSGELTLSNKFLTPFLVVVMWNFFYCYTMLCTLVKIIIQEGKIGKAGE